MTTKGTKSDFAASIAKLRGIVQWFEEQDEVDIEAGLEKMREGASLVAACRSRLSELENEFNEIKVTLGKDKA
ncbi:MAG TPA: exodeoxyribonuclease VII small subunit [Candidatus Paceibacterota bacterium]|nr:exodeoxyribonuclease VII small subunit [Candidatus Paceibacterota bacterium]